VTLNETEAWRALTTRREAGLPTLRELFAADPDRAGRLAVEAGDLWVDPSRQHLDEGILEALASLADDRDVAGFLRRVAEGDVVNPTEGRAATHGLQRLPRDEAPADVVANRDRMAELATAIRDGAPLLPGGAPVETVVHLGIGGGHLGPALVVEALGGPGGPEVDVRFASGVDPAELAATLHGPDPETTLVVACSKSFTTVETRTTLDACLAWLASGGGTATDRVVAVTSEPDRAAALGIDAERVLIQPHGVGGRFSLSSAVGLSAMVAIGTEAFEDLLAGMHVVDVATAERPTSDNAAILLALIDVWNRSVLGRTSRAVVPYAHRLRLLPAHLQQLSMESLGKGVAADGGPVATPTGSVLWGSSGTDAQHTFFQLLHQGSDVIPVDLVGVARPAVGATGSGEGWDDPRHGHDLLVANLAAQADALAFGRTAAEARATGVAEGLVPHRTFVGDRPSTIVLAPELTASTLGQLVSLAENRTVATGALLGVNPFDQWGVELGKELAAGLADDLATGRIGETEPEVIARYRALRDEQAD